MKKPLSCASRLLWLLPLLALIGLLAFRAADRQRKEAAFFPVEEGRQYAARVPMEEMDLNVFHNLYGYTFLFPQSGSVLRFATESPITYYRQENGGKVPAITIPAGTEVEVGSGMLPFFFSYPTYEKGWRWAQPVVVPDAEWNEVRGEYFYVKTEELQALAVQWKCEWEKANAGRPFTTSLCGIRWPLDYDAGEILFELDVALYVNRIFLSPDLPWPFWETDCTLLLCAAILLALLPLGQRALRRLRPGWAPVCRRAAARALCLLWLLPCLGLGGLLGSRAAERQRLRDAFSPLSDESSYRGYLDGVPMEELDADAYRIFLNWSGPAVSWDTAGIAGSSLTYYEKEGGRLIPALTIRPGKWLAALSPGEFGYGFQSLPTQERGWRYAKPFVPREEGDSGEPEALPDDLPWYYVRLEELTEFRRRLLSRDGRPSCFEEESLLSVDDAFFQKGVALSPDLLPPLWQADCTLLACAAGALALIPLGRGAVFLARRRGKQP